MKIGIIGSGYVDFFPGVCLSYLGHTVTCADRNKAKIRALKKNDQSMTIDFSQRTAVLCKSAVCL
ncbi:MAG: hypothetical protein A2351_07815 [Omnitrophica bacterium RIFOXYB12_FULL_50_7]|nr:MAG: hypothetical protein A2351_07815 [Omnitrophica bacterium RIFOXYB12_FULL_50_7]